MIDPPRWSAAALEADRAAARREYRRRRVEEPAGTYAAAYDAASRAIGELLDVSRDLAALRQALPHVLADERLRRALRYTTGPPVSDDDLQTIAEVELSQRYLRAHPSAYDAVAEAIYATLDRQRFPWVAEGRTPEAAERTVAVVATAVSDAAQAVHSLRRNAARALEAATAAVLVGAGFSEVPKRAVRAAADWPRPGEFCGEQTVAGRQADLVVTLFDSRYMPIECKVSGSAINSIKRLNNDTMAKFATWTTEFGRGQTIPAAVLEGVYDHERLVAAQSAGATIFWSHRLEALARFVTDAR